MSKELVRLKNEFRHDGEEVVIKIKCLGKFHDLLLDLNGFERISGLMVTVCGSSEGAGIYPVFYFNGKMVRLHRFLTTAQAGEDVDHINHNTLDNRMSNLRKCTHSQNLQNVKPYKTSSSGYRNVSFIKTIGKWQVAMRVNGKTKTIGHYDSPDVANDEAIKARKELMTHAVN